MKTLFVLFAAASLLLTPALSFAAEPEQAVKPEVVKNLIQNLKSDNRGVHESSAFMLGELKSDEALIPLLTILHNDTEESSRIVAALSLSKIGAPRGIYAVKQAVWFDASPRVRLVCAWFVNQYSSPEPFKFIRLDEVQDMNIASR